MNVTIKGRFFVDSYGQLKSDDSESTVNSMIERAFKKGSIVTLSVTVEYAGSLPLCQEQNKYGYKCDDVLNKDGTCPSKDRHEVKVTDDEKDDNE